jgi:hypothetical protein
MGSMRWLRVVVVGLVSAALLSSCALLPGGPGSHTFDSDVQRVDARMTQIAAAVNSHNGAALKAMFTTPALEKATAIDDRLKGFLSSFPNGGLTWKLDGVSAEISFDHGQMTELLQAHYKVSANGKKYALFFADSSVRFPADRHNTGIYALGITPWYEGEDQFFGPAESFSHWAGSMSIDRSHEDGYPGIYAGFDNSQMSLQTLPQIVDKVNIQDTLGLEEKFSKYARIGRATEIKDGVSQLIALFPDGNVVWQKDKQAPPTVREKTDNGGRTLLLVSRYRVSVGSVDYWLVCADFRENTTHPQNLGIYAIGVAPWTQTGDSAGEKALFSWADSFDIDATTPAGIFIAQ